MKVRRSTDILLPINVAPEPAAPREFCQQYWRSAVASPHNADQNIGFHDLAPWRRMQESDLGGNLVGGSVRRVVTGHDSDGKAIIQSDGITPVVFGIPQRPGYSANEIWVTSSMPAEINAPGEPTERPRSIEPPPNGTICRVVVLPPEASFIGSLDRETAKAAFAAFGSAHAATVDESETQPHPLMHRTKTVDYGIVLEGEIYLVLDKEETLLKAGDVVVQRGTNHAWSNRSDLPCKMAFILVDGK